MRSCIAEGFGTFVLVFAGTSAIVLDATSGGALGQVGVALTFGLVVMALIHALGDVSGAHLNPAVTLAFAAARRFPFRRVPGFVLAQCAGALAASALVAWLHPGAPTLGETTPAAALSPARALALEALLTLCLMFVILSVSTGAKEKGITAGAAIGAVVLLEALFAGPSTGASMNPARSLGPALVSGRVGALWIYLVAPTLGALAAVPLCRAIRGRACCTARSGCTPTPA